MHRALPALAVLFLSLGSNSGLAAGSPGDIMLFGKDPGEAKAFACFTRHYDPRHLASHPEQNVTDMTLLVDSYPDADMGRQYILGIGVNFRSVEDQLQLSGGCSASAEGENLLNCGIDCDGGIIDVKPRDASSVLVSIPDGARTWDPDAAGEPPAAAVFGVDDKLFRLDRVAVSECLPLVFDDETRAAILAQN